MPPDELEEMLYAVAAEELDQGTQRSGLMARAFADAEGDEQKAKAFYLRLRVKQLKAEFQEAIRVRLALQQKEEEVRQREEQKRAEEIRRIEEHVPLGLALFILAVSALITIVVVAGVVSAPQ